jgi:hypothetical protein
MPIINWISIVEPEEKGKENDLEKLAEERMNEADNLILAVNGKSIPLNFKNFRIGPLSGGIALPEDNIFDMQAGATSYIVDGFWVLLKPLSSDLTLDTSGSCQSGIIQISSKYHIIFEKH